MITVIAAVTVIKCDCHSIETMAKIENGVLVILSKHHGVTHIATTPIDKLTALCNPLLRADITK